MKELERGRVMPFGMSGVRLRASAREYRRRGQVLEALSLVRRAAMQDDTAAAWQALAAELRQLACWEAASTVLGRVLSREDAAPSAWLDMARCMSAMGETETAEDCLYHLLQESPWSAEGDAAREMLHAMTEEDGQEDSRRVRLLSQRAMQAWNGGERALGLRRLRRAIRLSRDKTRLMTTLALLYMVDDQPERSLRCMARAMKAAPAEGLSICAMAALLHQVGRRRMARGVLRKAAPLCTSLELEKRYCSTAWLMDAWPELDEFLTARLKRTPHRIPLLHEKARMYYETKRCGEAQQQWKTILSIDPTDCMAAGLLEWSQNNPGVVLPPGRVPSPAMARQREALLGAEDLFTWGSAARNALDWCITSTDMREQMLALAAAEKHPDRAAEKSWLRELLTRRDVPELVRQQALMRLAALGHFEPLTVLLSGRYVTAQCQPTQLSATKRMWHVFLPTLLRAAAPYGRVSEIAAFGAQMWRTMTDAERQEAAMTQSFSWSRMMVVMWLWQQGRSEEADREMASVRLSVRHFRRLVSRFLVTLEKDTGDAGEGES